MGPDDEEVKKEIKRGYKKLRAGRCHEQLQKIVGGSVGRLCYKKRTEDGEKNLFYVFYDLCEYSRHRPAWRLIEVKTLVYRNASGSEHIYLYRPFYSCPSRKPDKVPTRGWKKDKSSGWINAEYKKRQKASRN